MGDLNIQQTFSKYSTMNGKACTTVHYRYGKFCDPYATKFSHIWVAATKSVWIVLLGLESCFSGRDENELISQAYYVDPLRKT